jgi:hypothetical protein
VTDGSDLDDMTLMAEFLQLSSTHADAARQFANDYGNVDVPRDDERHPANWSAARRQQMQKDGDALLALGARFDVVTRELVRRRVG